MHSTVLLLGLRMDLVLASVGAREGGAEQTTAGRYPRGVPSLLSLRYRSVVRRPRLSLSWGALVVPG